MSKIIDFDSLPENVKRLIEITYRSGHIRPQVSVKLGDQRFVAVGNRILWGKWVTFPDFLTDYCKTVIGVEWGNEELKKPFDKRHLIIQWFTLWGEFAKGKEQMPDGTFEAVHSGPVAAWFHLAYDLYVLQHHSVLQSALINRLKNITQFQGARYELLIAATFIRAGFTIKHEDESDRTRKHPEFIATYEKTNEAVAVEVKSRHRPGVLGMIGKLENPLEVKASIGRLLQDAIDKDIKQPYIVCIDLNLPPFSSSNIFDQPQIKEVMETLSRKEKEYPANCFPITTFVATNFPHYYVKNDVDDPRKSFLVSPSTNPKYPIKTVDITRMIYNSFYEYDYIPNYFIDND